MKPLFLFLILITSPVVGYSSFSEYNSKRSEELVLSADTAVLRGELEPVGKGIVIKDRKWILAFAEALKKTHLSETDHVFGVGFLTVFFYHDGEQVLSVAPIIGPRIRAYSKKGGGDFIVTEEECQKIQDLIEQGKGLTSR